MLFEKLKTREQQVCQGKSLVIYFYLDQKLKYPKRGLPNMDYTCSICKKSITPRVNQYSKDHFGKPLCLEHQKTAKDQKQYFCCECKQPITYGEYKFSQRNFEMPLCRECQPEEEEKVSAPPQRYQLNRTSKIEFGS